VAAVADRQRQAFTAAGVPLPEVTQQVSG
jgi:hypothetical protein